MAILSNLVVNGPGRILNKLYVNDLDVGGGATFESISATNVTASSSLTSSGILTVAGNTTLNGDVTVAAGKTLNLLNSTEASGTASNNVALIIGSKSGKHLEFDHDAIMAKTNGTSINALYINEHGGNVYLSGGTTKVTANNGTLSAAIVTAPLMTATNLNVSNTLRATRFDL